jgi:hypothetical protein
MLPEAIIWQQHEETDKQNFKTIAQKARDQEDCGSRPTHAKSKTLSQKHPTQDWGCGSNASAPI